MHDYLFTTEVVRFAFMFGVAVSMVLYERRHLTTGSIVVPGYIATFLPMPMTIVATFVNAFISYLIVNKVLRRWFLLYGRTKFTVLAMISILIQTLMLKFSPTGSWAWESDIKLLVGVGYVVPALIAHDMGRQGIKKTVKAVLLAGVIVATPIALALAANMPGVNDLAPLRGGSDIAIDVAWIPIAVLLSAASAWGVARFLDLRSGGFMGAGFVAILLGDPWQVVVIACLAVITYVLVTRFLMNSMILFGRRKFSAMLLVSSSLSWMLLWVGGAIFGLGVQRHMDVGSLALTPLIVPGLLANDAQRTSPARVLGGLSVATTFVLSMTWWIESIFEQRPLDLAWKLTAIGTGVAIFGRAALTKIYVTMRAANEGRRAAIGLAGTATAEADDPWYGFAFASYQKWSALHRETAIVAEHWLSTMLGETTTLAVAGQSRAADSSIERSGRATHRIVQADSVEDRAAPTQLEADTDQLTTVDRLRAAALRARHAPARSLREPAPLPQRMRPQPVRRPGGQRRGEFDATGFDPIRPMPAIGRRPGDLGLIPQTSVWPPPGLDDDREPALLRSRPPAVVADSTISEASGAATTRAHQPAVPDARGTKPTDHTDHTAVVQRDPEHGTAPLTGASTGRDSS